MTFEEYKAEAFAINNPSELLKFIKKHYKEFGQVPEVCQRYSDLAKERALAENDGYYYSVDVWRR